MKPKKKKNPKNPLLYIYVLFYRPRVPSIGDKSLKYFVGNSAVYYWYDVYYLSLSYYILCKLVSWTAVKATTRHTVVGCFRGISLNFWPQEHRDYSCIVLCVNTLMDTTAIAVPMTVIRVQLSKRKTKENVHYEYIYIYFF